MRDVAIQDSEVLLEWRNQAEVRKFSRNQGLISKDSHAQWFKTRLKQVPNEPFWIFENSLGRVGFVRFDFDIASKYFEISIVINPAMRGKGLGKIVLELAIANCIERNPGSIFFAEAHKKNLSSQLLFLKCGFQEFAINGEFLAYRRIASHN